MMTENYADAFIYDSMGGKGKSRQSDTVFGIQNLKMAARDHSSGIIRDNSIK